MNLRWIRVSAGSVREQVWMPTILFSCSKHLRVVVSSPKRSLRGPGAVEFRKKDPNAMHRGHDLWLLVLKQVSEE